MPIIRIRHITTYKYKRAVAFGAHRMMLRPRDDLDQKVLESEIRITPEPTDLTWTNDRFGNHVAMAHFEGRSTELRFESTSRLDQAAVELRHTDITETIRTFPLAYPPQLRSRLAGYMAPRSLHPRLVRWAHAFLRKNRARPTRDLLAELTRTIHASFIQCARHEKGIQDPVHTLAVRSGSCRDHAVFLIAVLHSLGMAARFVSGYLEVSDEDGTEEGGNTHAWVQAYVPGLGWVDLDPSNGLVGNHRHVRVAVVAQPQAAIPLQGTWFGDRSDHVGMTVMVKVWAERRSGFDSPLITDGGRRRGDD
jgi:transglutaminase-like putative cysteine protease